MTHFQPFSGHLGLFQARAGSGDSCEATGAQMKNVAEIVGRMRTSSVQTQPHLLVSQVVLEYAGVRTQAY